MTDTNDTADDGSIVSSRRTVLAATFGIPVVGSVGVGAADAVRRLSDSGMTEDDGGATIADVTVDFASGRHPIDDNRYTQITLDPELLEDLGLSVGEQVLLERGEDDRAVYTVAAAMTEADASTVRMNRRARARLDIANTAWAEVGDYGTGCPELLGTSDLVDETFDATAVSDAVNAGSVADAEANGGLAEDTDGDGAELAVLAPHGGEIEPHTHDIASDIHGATGAQSSYWSARGYRPGGGAFLRWHVPSAEIEPASYPELESTLKDDYDYAVSVHGICTNQIRVGGGAPAALREQVVDAINYHLPSGASRAEIANGRFSAQDPDVLANSASDNGIWLGLTQAARNDHADAIVDAVVSVVDGEL